LATVLPAGRLTGVYILFPTPATNPRHLLLTPALVQSLARALAIDGVVHLATDVEGMFGHARTLFAGWRAAVPPPLGPVLSRRERVCRRDDLPVWRATWSPPTENP
jgi:tRNA G46 methylase TrmB